MSTREDIERKRKPLASEVKPNSSVTLHVVSSLDGFIAKKDNSVSWLDSPGDVYERGISEESAGEGIKIDCFVLGSRTYEHALQLGWPYGDTPTVVTTSRELPSTRKSVEFYSGDLKRLVEEILAPRYGNIWLVGGAILCQSFLKLGLVDEIRLSIAPVILGDGLSLFGNSGVEKRWRLKDVVAYKTGFVELLYGSESTNS
ncbi:MAG TPA: dihydrofolate reductase family protein [Candidatus Acidoferrales bacterium]|nr:dihydrofolate reductase family protein [Candidatus Acidoferrales bacterium]